MNQRSSPWPVVGLLLVTATASYLCRVNISTAGALLMEEFALSQVAMGRVFSAFLLGYALCQIPAGALADRFGAKRTLTVAAVLWTALTVAQSVVGWEALPFGAGAAMITLLVLRFLLGAAEAPTYPAAAAGISRWVPAVQQGRATGIVIGSIGLGSALAPPLVSSLMVLWGWRIALAISSLPALAVALVWTQVVEPASTGTESVPPAATGPSAPARRKGWSFILLTASYSLQGYLGYIFVFWFYLYLVQERKFGLLEGAWVASLPWLLSIVSIPLGGLLSDRLVVGRLGPVWGRRMVPILGLGLSGILTSVGAHTESPAVAAVSLALATAFVLSVEGPFWATMMALAGPKSGTAGGIMNMGSNVGGLISPVLTPALAERIGWENALHIAGVLGCLAAALWLGIHPASEGPSSNVAT
jgi:ACS family glucarate transporter-like MFS transporter